MADVAPVSREHVAYSGVDEFDRPLGWGACKVCGKILWTTGGDRAALGRPCPGPPGLSVWR
jgi:hypothetical protein